MTGRQAVPPREARAPGRKELGREAELKAPTSVQASGMVGEKARGLERAARNEKGARRQVALETKGSPGMTRESLCLSVAARWGQRVGRSIASRQWSSLQPGSRGSPGEGDCRQARCAEAWKVEGARCRSDWHLHRIGSHQGSQ